MYRFWYRLKPGDKVRLRANRGRIWSIFGGMDKYCNQVVTIKSVNHPFFRIKEDSIWKFELSDIVELIETA